jgi:hypothetical protein
MDFTQTSRVRGDETASYAVSNYKAKTVREFVDEVILNEREWGYIKVVVKGVSWLSYPECEYRWGKLLSTLPAQYLDKEITNVEGDGGWSRMDYYISVKD